MKQKHIVANSLTIEDEEGNSRIFMKAWTKPNGPTLDMFGQDGSTISLSVLEGVAAISIREPDGKTAITISRQSDGRVAIVLGQTQILSFCGKPGGECAPVVNSPPPK